MLLGFLCHYCKINLKKICIFFKENIWIGIFFEKIKSKEWKKENREVKIIWLI